MSVPIVTFFNNKGGVGKTSLVYHLAWMLARLGKQVVALDLDPQANLSAAFLDDTEMERIWNSPDGPGTVFQAVEPLMRVGDIEQPALRALSDRLHLVVGDVALSSFEETLSTSWPESMGDRNLYRPFRIQTAFWQIAQGAAERVRADLILADVGPNLGAINRSALIGSDHVVIPLGADLYSLQGLRNLGPTLRSWRSQWNKRLDNWPHPDFRLPRAAMHPLGYVVQQANVRLSRPVKAYDRWVNRMPGVYRETVLQEPGTDLPTQADPHCLATLKHFRSLVPMAQEARRPLFDLTPADGAIGSHAIAVRDAYSDFEELAQRILARMEDAAPGASPSCR
ncbi:MAG: ParA family protein [Verrucomicrobiae bacterium]|nr:ParA family protein [Verrucomicrobiae bacterium]